MHKRLSGRQCNGFVMENKHSTKKYVERAPAAVLQWGLLPLTLPGPVGIRFKPLHEMPSCIVNIIIASHTPKLQRYSNVSFPLLHLL